MVGETGARRVPPKAFSFDCPSCGAAVPVLAPSLTVAAGCAQCGAVIDVQSEGYRILSRAAGARKIIPLIELGAKAKLRGQTWQAIGFMRRFEPGYDDEWWDEYLLFNPYFGYRWLTRTYNEHWNFVRTVKEQPQGAGRVVDFQGKSYSIFHVGTAEVSYVIGEFYWRVEAGEKTATLDAIAPPLMLSREKTDDEEVWSIAESMKASDVEGAFKLGKLPAPLGTSPNQPSPVGAMSFKRWAGAYGLAILALVVAHVAVSSVHPEEKLFQTTLDSGQLAAIEAQTASEAKVGTFTFSGARRAVLFALSAVLSNSYVDVGLRLVNEATGEAHEFGHELSSYSGYDEDGSWTEGDPRARLVASGVSAGTYAVLMTVATDRDKPASLTIEASQNPSVWSNVWLAAFLLLWPPLIFGGFSYYYESRRWNESEYDPYPHAPSAGD